MNSVIITIVKIPRILHDVEKIRGNVDIFSNMPPCEKFDEIALNVAKARAWLDHDDLIV